jgi:hypothetical protein
MPVAGWQDFQKHTFERLETDMLAGGMEAGLD